MFSVSLTASAVAVRGNRNDGLDHALVEGLHKRRRVNAVACHDLGDRRDFKAAVAGILAFGREAEEEIYLRLQAGLFQYGLDHVVGGAGIGGRFQHDQLAGAQMLGDGACRVRDKGEIRLTVFRQRRRNADDDDIADGKFGKIRSGAEPSARHLAGKGCRRHRLDIGLAVVQALDLLGFDVEAGNREAGACDRNRQRQPDIAQSDHADLRGARRNPVQKTVIYRS